MFNLPLGWNSIFFFFPNCFYWPWSGPCSHLLYLNFLCLDPHFLYDSALLYPPLFSDSLCGFWISKIVQDLLSLVWDISSFFFNSYLRFHLWILPIRIKCKNLNCLSLMSTPSPLFQTLTITQPALLEDPLDADFSITIIIIHPYTYYIHIWIFAVLVSMNLHL